ncbi:MAG: hypothetical protein ACMXYF_01075 [Candidatus Woesearchaeota archaeon]
MIQLSGTTSQQNIRLMGDLIEPFIVKKIQKEYHTHFVFRCADFRNYQSFLRINQFESTCIQAFNNLLEKYWSCIDIIYVKVKNMPAFTPTKEYFDLIEQLREQKNEIIDFEIYEVKFTSNSQLKPILSSKSYDCILTFEKMCKKIRIITILSTGFCRLQIEEKSFSREDFFIKTHYGRLEKSQYR